MKTLTKDQLITRAEEISQTLLYGLLGHDILEITLLAARFINIKRIIKRR